ncbi:MAG: thiamine-phosphate kinase [Candidatus Omnitrophica bacterium]|nr:thiamine-phosphate kinase [Candidatus Omnitrophota bacterium]
MQLSKLGEFGLIRKIRSIIKTDSSVIKGSGDDCAVLRLDRANYQLFCCDMLIEGVDFKPTDDPYLIGRKAIAISLSDIAACGGIPRYCLVSVGISPKKTLVFFQDLLRGMLDIAKRYRMNLVGGDLTRSDKLIIDVSILGKVEKKNLLLRSGAKTGDIIFVTGTLGGSIFRKHLEFIPRIKEARFLVRNFKINSMIDISDGLVQDLSHILEESKRGAIIYEELIPLSKEARDLEDALYSGEDFELLFTVSISEAKKIYRKKIKLFKPIGEIVDKNYGLRLIDKQGKTKIIKIKGFRHF